MTSQPTISNFFQKKRSSACTEAFLRQYDEVMATDETHGQIIEKNRMPPDCCQHLEQIKVIKASEIGLKQEIDQIKSTTHILEKKVKILSEKYSKLKTKHFSLLQILMDKETKINNLQMKLNNIHVSEGKPTAPQDCLDEHGANSVKCDLLESVKFMNNGEENEEEKEDDHIFTEEEIKKLNSTSLLQKSDAVYIRQIIEFLYKENLNVLNKRSFSGRTTTRKVGRDGEIAQDSNDTMPFKPILPKKKKIIYKRFTNRITSSNIPDQEQIQRLNYDYIARLIA